MNESVNSHLDTNGWSLAEYVYNGAGSTSYTNGVSAGATGNITATCDGFVLGASFVPSNGMNFMLAEAMTYSTALTTADRQALYEYVRNKYGTGNFPAPPW